jgi:selenocysteine lyase/cysteine desulfurase
MGLDFQTGDEVITTTQDYPRMLTAWKQRERRDGIVLKQVKVPIPCSNPQAVVDAYEKAITPKTRLLMICHMINLTGQILPVARVCEMARKHGVQVMVDGAHGFAHFPFKMSDLGADYYATSLHKWLAAPIGTGLLWMKKEHISKVWPLLAANEGQDLDIRKFEETGTSPIGGILAVMQALDLHKKIGDERKAARLRWLRDRWIAGLEDLPGFKLLTNLEPEHSCGIATFSIEGMGCTKLHKYLIRNRIVISPILHPEMEGVRVSPSIYSTAKEVDRFVKRIRYAAKHGLD